MPDIVLLGPQRQHPNVASALKRLGAEGPVATVTCGWQEAEGEEAEELRSHLDQPIIDLTLHQRGDDVFHKDPEFFAAYRERQDELRQLQELYRIRLSHALAAARELMRRSGNDRLLEPERAAAIENLRALDEHHLRRLREIHERFASEWRPDQRQAVASHRRELAKNLDDASGLVIAGGHVAVLLYRLKLFNLAPLIGNKPVVAWSAGAMALSERIVLFHDSPPQGRDNPEVLDYGLGLVKDVTPFPNASRRLRLQDRGRVALLARRFAPDASVALDEGAELYYQDSQWSARPGTLQLSLSGGLLEFSA
jgi:hypothetical protein